MIKQAIIKNFQAFEEFKLENFTPVNVIVGGNNTGKTGLLKILYAVSKTWEEFGIRKQNNPTVFKEVLLNKLHGIFNPKNDIISELVKKGAAGKLDVELAFQDSNQLIKFSFSSQASKKIECNEIISPPSDNYNALFIPAKEVLTIFRAIEGSRQNLFIPDFDDTYFDLVKALKIPTQKGKVHTKLVDINNTLEMLFDGEIRQERQNGLDVSFMYKTKANQKFAMSLTAEGIKKTGILTTLIRNRQIAPGTVLFFDEPEATLHPKAIREMAEIIHAMSKTGIQIFLSTHSYFMLKQLSLIARREEKNMSCISLERTSDKKSIQSAVSNLRHGLPENAIVAEALAMMDDETNIDLK